MEGGTEEGLKFLTAPSTSHSPPKKKKKEKLCPSDSGLKGWLSQAKLMVAPRDCAGVRNPVKEYNVSLKENYSTCSLV